MNSTNEWGKKYQVVPVGPLGIIALKGSKELAKLIDDFIIKHRSDFIKKNIDSWSFTGFIRESFLINCDCCRFANGERKAFFPRL